MNLLRKLKITVFLSGFVLMVFELVGLRILAPFLGSSSIVWTSVIGIILLFMSIGYWKGGQLADRLPKTQTLGLILGASSASIFLMNLIKNPFLGYLNSYSMPLIIKSIIACAILFGTTSFLIAMISPLALRLSIDTKENSGTTIGSIYSFSALGSILGTFLGGFILISWMGTNAIIYGLALILFVISFFFISKTTKQITLFIGLLIVANTALLFRTHDYIDIDSDYSRIFIQDTEYEHQPAKYLMLNGYVNSGMATDSPNKLIFEYTQFYDVFDLFNTSAQKVLMLGGGAFSYPKHFQETFPNKELDVVEIDPVLLEISQNHFAFHQSPKTNVFLEDARTYLQHTGNKYDVILYDVLTSPLSVPFHLTTQEAFQQVSSILENDGILILNIIADLNGPSRIFLDSEYLTLKSVFPKVQIYSAQEKNVNGLHNYMMIAFKSNATIDFSNASRSYQSLLNNPVDFHPSSMGQILTDNFAPTDRLLSGY